MTKKIFNAKLINKERLTDDNYLLKYQIIGDANFGFESGQFILVESDFEGVKLKRAYSFSSLSAELPVFELTIKRIEGGKMSNKMIDMNLEEKIKFYGPFGDFKWNSGDNRDKVLIATGCGIAPLKSMLYFWLSNDLVDGIELYYGNRFVDQVPYHKDFMELTKKYDCFDYFSCISNLKNDESEFYRGRVGDILDRFDKYDDKTDYYICGSAQMVGEMKERLLEKNIEIKNIFIENIFA